MALFGAPIPQADHARRAAVAALGIQRVLRKTSADLGGQDGLAVRIGLNTGPVVVGTIGDNLRMGYTAVGDTTNLAARLQQNAEPGTVLVSEATSRLVKGHVRLEPLTPLTVNGKVKPVVVFRVVDLGTRRSPLKRRGEDGSLSPFVGRDRDLTTLRNVRADAGAGGGQVVGVVGEAGVGKSRLLYELRQSLSDGRVTYLEGRCLSYGSSIPYLPLQDGSLDNPC